MRLRGTLRRLGDRLPTPRPVGTAAPEPTRRRLLATLGGGGLALGAAKAVDNVLVGYGVLTGTNLRAQAGSGALAALAGEGFHPRRGYEVSAGEWTVTTGADRVRVRRGDDLVAARPPAEFDADWAAARDLPTALAAFVADLGAIARGEYAFEFHRVDAFFDRLAEAEPRPLVTGAMRRWPGADSALVEAFAGTRPQDPRATLRGLIGGFRDHGYYDGPRYAAGSIQDNVLFGAVDLRAPFRDPVDFASLLARDGTGLFCYEFTHRSIEALHAVPAHEQTVPVVGARVIDDRHKHVYTAVGSVVRDDGLRVPMTFVDYTHTTLYDDLALRGVLGEGFEGYNPRHRATAIHWSPFPSSA